MTNVINDKRHNLQTSYMTNIIGAIVTNDFCRLCQIITFVALWRLSHYDVCHNMTFVALWCLLHYDVCRLCRLSPCDVCWLVTFVALWCLSHYDLCRLLYLSHYYFDTYVWGLLHYDVCRQLWRLLLIGFVAVSIFGIIYST